MAFKTALVVDDSKSARFALRRFLENQYYKVETAESAEECYTVLEGLRPDVIFLDHVMPGIDGFTALRHIKADPVTSDLKVVICSSNEGSEFVQLATECGATGVLHKPPSAEQLTRILDTLNRPAIPEPASVFASAPSLPATPAPAPMTAAAPAPSKVSNIREPEVAIEQRVMNTLRSSLSAPPAPAGNGLSEVAQSLNAQIAQLQAHAAQLQSRIGEEQAAAKQHSDLDQLATELALQSDRIAALEQLVDEHFSELHAALEAGLRAQSERVDQIVAAAGERAREEAERTVMNAAARISDQLANAALNALRNVNPSAPRSPAEPSPPGTADRLKA